LAVKTFPPAPFQHDGGVTPQDAIFDFRYWVLEIKMKSIRNTEQEIRNRKIAQWLKWLNGQMVGTFNHPGRVRCL